MECRSWEIGRAKEEAPAVWIGDGETRKKRVQKIAHMYIPRVVRLVGLTPTLSAAAGANQTRCAQLRPFNVCLSTVYSVCIYGPCDDACCVVL